MRSILITGGAGFIGANFVHHMRQAHKDDRLVVLDKLTYAGNLENLSAIEPGEKFKFVKGDITDFDFVDRLFKEEKIDTVAHFAAESHVDRSITGPKAFIDTNINGTFALLEAARKNWADKFEGKRFLHVSTDEVYGSLGDTGLFTEDTPYSPNSPYSASKAGSDHLVRAYHHTYGMPTVTTNCSNNYGPYQFPEKLIPLMVINAFKGKPLPVYGKGLNVRDWLYVEDHCRAIDTVISKGVLGQTYNVGGRNEWKNIDIVRLVCAIVDEMTAKDAALAEKYPFKGKREELINYVKDRPGHDMRYAIDCTKIEKELGWRVRESFETGIKKTIEWYVANQNWWEHILSGEYKNYFDEQYGDRLKG